MARVRREKRNPGAGEQLSLGNIERRLLMPGSTTAKEPAAEGVPCRPPPSRPAGRITRRSLVAGVVATTFCCAAHTARARTVTRRLSLLNPSTDDRFEGVYWRNGTYVEEALRRIDWVMRDFHQDKAVPMDAALLDLLHRLTLRLGTRHPVHILSGYRTRATNRLLRREGYAPAVNSLHLEAKAADICIRGVSFHHLHRAALSLRMGGVGSYPHEHFVHVDVGPCRVWSNYAGPHRRDATG
jgi:uncharacterized protein YcbK (DUF882 family)